MVAVAKITPQKWRRDFLSLNPWSDYQKAIFDWCINGTGHAAVEAVAGSGKTTTLFGIIGALPATAKIQVLAFNVAIKEKIKNDPRVPKSRVTVSTAHSCGKGMLTAYFGGEPFLDERKTFRLSKDAIQDLIRARADYESLAEATRIALYPVAPPKLNEKYLDWFRESLSHITNLARLTLTPWEPQALKEMMEHYQIQFPGWEAGLYWGLKLAIEMLQAGEKQAASERRIDYTDMLFLPHHWELEPIGKKDFLLIDEAQDANAAMISLYKKFASQGTRLVMVGDSKQAIMGFAGADNESFAHLKKAFNPTELPLSICYRCPTSHLDLARRLVGHIEAKANAALGALTTLHPALVIKEAKAQDLIICRLTAPLISNCLHLIVAGKPAKVRGKDIGKNLVALAKRALGENPYSEFRNCLEDYCIARINQFRKEGDDEEAESLSDRFQALRFCYEEFGRECQEFTQLCTRITALFIDEHEESSTFIILSTIHRAKGDEAKRVFILRPNILPFTWKNQLPWQLEQEWNLVYVALTRAEENLYFVPLPSREDSDEIQEFLTHPLGGLELLAAALLKHKIEKPLEVGDVVRYLNPDQLLFFKDLENIDLEILQIDTEGQLVTCKFPDGSEDTFALWALRRNPIRQR